MTPQVPDHLLAMFLVVIFPYYAARSYRRFVRKVRAGEAGVRLAEYRTTMVIQWVLTGLALLIWRQAGRGWEALGFAVPSGVPLRIGAGFTAAGLALFAVQWMAIRKAEGSALDPVRAQLEPVKELLPQSDAEYRGFQALALTAGTCEEVLYRGFLVSYVAALVGVWPAVFIAGTVFGVAHFYQGVRGMIKIGLLGVATAALFVASGSLLWPMILHVAMDLQGGAIGRRVLTASPASAVG
jgi:membrane protease YdiL (CAAX protease family)